MIAWLRVAVSVVAAVAGVSVVKMMMSETTAAVWVDVVSPLVGAVAAALGVLLTVRQRQSESRLAEVEQANKNRHQWVDQIQEQLDNEIRNSTELRVLFNRMYRLLLEYHYGTPKLVEQVEAVGLEPAWCPPSNEEVEALLLGARPGDNSGD